jgi:putative membrane protein
MKTAEEKKYNRIIIVLSVALPLTIAALFGVKIDLELPVFLPPFYATTNAITALVLVFAIIAIKKGNRVLHEKLIKTAMLLSVLFLILYVLYHMTSNSTAYVGNFKTIYFVILISHILLSIVVIPFVLVTYMRAKLGKFEEHKKIAKYTFPLWLYVAVSGVVVYLMIAPYYIQ